ncbi:MAG: hypothetical protein Q8933_05195 [Bacteroidota bacterium]|nr:hypothetical protein [Bacteroidota bacterium]MDP4190801.1 hypothetical protein [Bacteroidota bacterium]MDP4195742.1 hypothetical protein [Bacteroidota bacterium]
MKNKEYRLSDNFIQELRRATTGYLPAEIFDKLLEAFEEEISKVYFSSSVEANLHRMIFSLFDKVSFLSDAVKFPHYIQIIISIAVNSNYLTDIIIRNPEYLYWIISPENLKARITDEYLRKSIHTSLSKYRSFNAKVNFLRAIKRREILRIGVNDILGNLPLKETTEQLSILAKVINDELFYLCYNELLERHGIKAGKSRYCLIALGKLGGNELNFSSDVDFILFFDKNTTHGKIEFYELLTEATHLFIQTSNTITDKGYIYRVDFRLRPDGRNSPLCRTLKDYLRYYESRGEDWERQMLIKMSFAGGSKKLYSTFSDYIQNFVYPHSFASSPLEQIAQMKANIEKNSGDKENVKLFSGGIRDIEFSVQALQMLNGGNLKEIRSGNTLEAIDLLTNCKLLTSDEAALFISAYEFYRKIEHYLQLMNDIQTHVIPKSGETLEKLALFMKFKNAESFLKKVEATRKAVRKVFISITGQKESSRVSSFEEIGFTDTKKAINNFKYLQSGYGLLEQKQFDRQTTTAFQEIEEVLVDFLKSSISPDLLLENFVRIIKTRPLPSIWYHEFRDTAFFTSFLKICERCQKAVDMTVLDKSLGDLLLSRSVFIKEAEHLSLFNIHQLIFTLSIQFALGFISHDKASYYLAKQLKRIVTDTCLDQIYPYKYFIIGLGSFSAEEMSFSSDADIVIVAENVNNFPSIQFDFQKLFNSVQMNARPFELDGRLRPEGKSGQLVWDIKNYMEYIDKRIQTWEIQSLTKLNFICGDKGLFDTFYEKIRQKIGFVDHEKLNSEIIEMRKKIDKQLSLTPQSHFNDFFNIKKSRGGITDIEFALQKLLLSDPELYNTLHGRSAIKIINFLLEFSEKFHSFVALKKGYSFLKTLEFWNQILFNISNSILPLDPNRRLLLAKIMGFADTKEFESELYAVIKTNSNLVEEVFNNKVT